MSKEAVKKSTTFQSVAEKWGGSRPAHPKTESLFRIFRIMEGEFPPNINTIQIPIIPLIPLKLLTFKIKWLVDAQEQF